MGQGAYRYEHVEQIRRDDDAEPRRPEEQGDTGDAGQGNPFRHCSFLPIRMTN
jgi:hypothetical protein